jgi:hypothetical protein
VNRRSASDRAIIESIVRKRDGTSGRSARMIGAAAATTDTGDVRVRITMLIELEAFGR